MQIKSAILILIQFICMLLTVLISIVSILDDNMLTEDGKMFKYGLGSPHTEINIINLITGITALIFVAIQLSKFTRNK